MRRIISVFSAIILSVGTLILVASSSVYAADLTPDQVQRIKSNCVPIKTSLNQLHASDALLRVNRGQVYESMASKLMDAFNDRLGSNRLDNRATSTATVNYRAALDTFRNDYIKYEQKLAATIRIDCITQPDTFFTSLEEARELRKVVHEDVLRLHRHIDDYRSSVNGFLINFGRVSE